MRKLILCLATVVATISLSAQRGDSRSVSSLNFIGNHSFNHRRSAEQSCSRSLPPFYCFRELALIEGSLNWMPLPSKTFITQMDFLRQ